MLGEAGGRDARQSRQPVPAQAQQDRRRAEGPRGVDYGAASAARPGKAPPPAWFTEVHHLGLLPGGLKEVGFNAAEVEKITSGNWLRLYREVFGAAEQVRDARLEFVQNDPVLATTPRAAAS